MTSLGSMLLRAAIVFFTNSLLLANSIGVVTCRRSAALLTDEDNLSRISSFLA